MSGVFARINWINRQHRLLALLLCAALLVIGFALRHVYGIAWDEPAQRGYGQTVARFMLKGDDRLQSDPLRVYGPAHELLLAAAETLSHARDTPDIYAVRHFVTFAVFVVGVYFLYRLAVIGVGPGSLALLPSIALVLSPPIFGHAFFNSKDIPFLAAFIVSVYTLLRFLDRPGVRTGLVHAIVTAWLMAIRAPGLLMPVLTVIGIAFCLRPLGPDRAKLVRGLIAFAVALPLLTIAFWPTLWHQPWASFGNAVATMSRFPWTQQVLYRGAFLSATDLPWHYAPVWIAITTPVLYLVGFVAGLPVVISRAWWSFRAPATASSFYPSLILLWLCVPLVSVVLFRSVLYDGWRQLFFVYPALLLIATDGVAAVARALRTREDWRWGRTLAAAAVTISLLALGDIAAFMVRAHPQAHVFFNTLVGGVSGAKFRYEMDYWGLATRAGLEAILRDDRDPVIPVFAADPTGPINAQALSFADRHRLLFVDSLEGAKYSIGTYRLRQAEYANGPVAHHVDVSGVPILTVESVHPAISLTTDTVPSVVNLRARNAALLGDADLNFSAAQIRVSVKAWLARYVRGANMIEVELPSPLPAEVREGHVPFIGIRIRGAEVGDFQFDKPGIPIVAVDLRADDLLIDFARLAGGELPLARIGMVTVNEIVLDARAVNEALARSSGKEKNLRVGFDQGLLTADWLGRPAAGVTIRPAVVADPWRQASQNLEFEIDRVKLFGWRVPLATLAQLALGGLSPAIGPDDAITTRVMLGAVRLDGEQLRIGTHVR